RLRLGGKVIPTDSILWSSSPANPTLTPQKNTKNGVVFVNTTTVFAARIWRTGASCVVFDTVVVTLQPTIPINFTATQPYCTSQTGKLKAVPTGVPSSYTYVWRKDGLPIAPTTDSLNNIAAGTYSVTVTNPSGCTGTASYVLTPQILTLQIDTTNVDLTCFQDGTGSITPSVTGGNPFPLTKFGYDWADIAGTNNIKNRTGLAAGNYSLTVIDSTTGCIGVRTINIEEPQKLTFSADSIMLKCFNDSSGGISWIFTGGTGPSYTMDYVHSSGWPVGNAIGSGGIGNGVSGLKAGKYQLTLTDNNGCKVKDSTILFEPTILTNTMTKRDASYVKGTDGAAFANPLGGTPNYKFEWWSDSTQATAGIPIAGNILTRNNLLSDSLSQVRKSRIWVLVTDANGCKIKDSIRIIDVNCKLGAEYVTDNVKCFGDSTGQIRLKAFDTLNFAKTNKYYFSVASPNGWSTNDSVPNSVTEGTLKKLPAGLYNVRITTNLGCDTVYDNIQITEPPRLIAQAFEIQTPSCIGVADGKANVKIVGTFTGTPPYKYSWSGGTTPTLDSTGGLLGGAFYIATVTDTNGCQSKPSVQMTLPTRVVTVLRQDSVKCFGQANGQAIVQTIFNGTAPYTYLWNNASIDSFTGPVAAGEYKLEVTDARGCKMRDSIFVREPRVLDATLTGLNPTCNGFTNGEITASTTGGNGGNSFQLNPGSVTNSTGTWNALPQGNYTVTVTDMKGCQVVKNTTLIEPAPLSFTTGFKNASCIESENGTAFIKNIGGGVGAPFTATWIRVSDNLNIVNSGPVPPNDQISNLRGQESYEVTLFDKNLCPLKKTINVGVDYVLTIDNIAPEHVKCFGGSDGKATVTMANGFSPFNYVWSNPEIPGLSLGSSKTALNIPRGTYTVSITDVNNCTATGNIAITEPSELQINLTPTMTLCFGSADGKMTATYSGGTLPYSKLEWLTTPPQFGDSAVGLRAGSYSFRLTDNNGCQKMATGIVPEPEEFRVLFSEQKHITCYGDNDGKLTVYVKGGTPNFSYVWNTTPPKTTPTIENLSPKKIYSVTATDRNNCTTSGFREIIEPEKLAFDHLKVDSVTCPRYADGVVDIQAIGGTISFGKLYEFSLDSINYSRYGKFTNLRKGRYTAWIRDNNGCLARRELEIFEPEELFINANPSDTLIDLAKTARLTIAKRTASGIIPYINSYKWYPAEGLSCVDCPSPIASAYESRLYEITVNYLHNCLAKSEAMVRIKDPLDIFVPSAFTPGNHDGLAINDVFKVYGLGVKKVTLYVFNRLGEKIFESNNMEIGWDGTYKGEMQMPGVYTYSAAVEYLNGQTTSKKGSVTLIR
nr:gliding motility-associated C-terminal domain-containing protein [Chitinophagales bacterium]